MVEIDVDYEGTLHCVASHGPSGSKLTTDAPRDNQGKGEAFSPTDLLATSLGSCMLTTMGIYAARKGFDLGGAHLHVVKEMTSSPRKVAKLTVTIDLPVGVPEGEVGELTRIARTCPVQLSINPDVQVDLKMHVRA